MTRYELIKALTKKAGVSEIEAIAFFEIFMLRLSEKIKLDKTVNLEGVGYFNTRKGLSKSSDPSTGKGEEEDNTELELMIFSDKLEEIADHKKNHLFILPKKEADNNNEIDSHFSLSLNKPVIAGESEGDNQSSSAENFETRYGQELRKYLTNKAEQLISAVHEVEPTGVLQNNEVTEISEPVSENVSVISHDRIQNIAEDLGENIPQAIAEREEKPKKLKISRVEEDQSKSDTLPWNFGRKFQVRKIDEHHEEEKKINPEEEDQTIQSKIFERKPEPFRIGKPKDTQDKDNIDSEDQDQKITKEELESEISEIIGNFQRVKPFLAEVKDKNDSSQTEDKKEKKAHERIKPSPTLLQRDPSGFMEVKSKSESFHLRDSVNQKKREWKKEVPKKEIAKRENQRNENDSFYGSRPARNNKPAIVFAIITVLIIVVGAVYFYVESENLFDGGDESTVNIVTGPPDVMKMESDDTIPAEHFSGDEASQSGLTANEIGQISTGQQKISEKPVKEEKGIEINTEPVKSLPVIVEKKEEKPKVIQEPVPPPATTKQLESVIKAGDYFNVLMGTFNSQQLAESEAEKYNDMGYNAFVQNVVVPGQGAKYRVRVGDFTSEENALKFKNLHSK